MTEIAYRVKDEEKNVKPSKMSEGPKKNNKRWHLCILKLSPLYHVTRVLIKIFIIQAGWK
jgi:hypothetical protein